MHPKYQITNWCFLVYTNIRESISR